MEIEDPDIQLINKLLLMKSNEEIKINKSKLEEETKLNDEIKEVQQKLKDISKRIKKLDCNEGKKTKK
jgi:hypothetical protein